MSTQVRDQSQQPLVLDDTTRVRNLEAKLHNRTIWGTVLVGVSLISVLILFILHGTSASNLDDRVSSVEAQIGTSARQEDLKILNKSFIISNITFTHRLNDHQVQIESLRTTIDNFETRVIPTISDLVNDMNKTQFELKVMEVKTRAEFNYVEKRLIALNTLSAKLLTDDVEMQNVLNSFNDQVMDMNKTLLNQIAVLRKENEIMKSLVGSIMKELPGLEVLVGNLGDVIKDVNSSVSFIRGRVMHLQDNITDIGKELNDYVDEVNELSQSVEKLEPLIEEYKDLNDTIQQQSKTIGSIKSDIKEFSEDIIEINDNIDSLLKPELVTIDSQTIKFDVQPGKANISYQTFGNGTFSANTTGYLICSGVLSLNSMNSSETDFNYKIRYFVGEETGVIYSSSFDKENDIHFFAPIPVEKGNNQEIELQFGMILNNDVQMKVKNNIASCILVT